MATRTNPHPAGAAPYRCPPKLSCAKINKGLPVHVVGAAIYRRAKLYLATVNKRLHDVLSDLYCHINVLVAYSILELYPVLCATTVLSKADFRIVCGIFYYTSASAYCWPRLVARSHHTRSARIKVLLAYKIGAPLVPSSLLIKVLHT